MLPATSSFEVFSQHDISMSKEGSEITFIGTMAQQSDTGEEITLQNVTVIRVPHMRLS